MARDHASVQAELERLGIPADAAARMAAADVSGRSPQLARAVLLHSAWRNVIDPGTEWIERYSGSYPAGEPLDALLAAGVDRALLTRLVRAMQFELLAQWICVLDEHRVHGSSARFGLFELGEDGRPTRPIEELHESLTASDPTGEADGWI